jgi:hypothetical protein
MMKNGRAGMAMENVRILRMFRRLLALLACACAAIGGAPSSFGQTSKFEGVYKGKIVLRTATGSFAGASSSCNPSTNQFEQTMTVSGDRLYLVRKAVQLNIVFSGTVSLEGTVSGSALMPRTDPGGSGTVNIVQMLTGKIENDQFTGTILDRFCDYTVELKK